MKHLMYLTAAVITCLISFCSVFNFNVRAQAQNITLTDSKTTALINLADVIQLRNGNFVLVGHEDKTPTIPYINSYNDSYDAITIATDSCLNPIWTSEVALWSDRIDGFGQVLQMDPGYSDNVKVIGSHRYYPLSSTSDQVGSDVQYNTTTGLYGPVNFYGPFPLSPSNTYYQEFMHLNEMSNTDWFTTGSKYYSTAGYSVPFAMRETQAGAPTWSNVYLPGAMYSYWTAAAEVAGTALHAAGEVCAGTYNNGNGILVTRLSSTGSVLWSNEYNLNLFGGSSYVGFGVAAVQGTDSVIIAGQYPTVFGTNGIWYMELDGSGNVVWADILDGETNTSEVVDGNTMQPITNSTPGSSQKFIAGYTTYNHSPSADIGLVVFDQYGKLRRSFVFGDPLLNETYQSVHYGYDSLELVIGGNVPDTRSAWVIVTNPEEPLACDEIKLDLDFKDVTSNVVVSDIGMLVYSSLDMPPIGFSDSLVSVYRSPRCSPSIEDSSNCLHYGDSTTVVLNGVNTDGASDTWSITQNGTTTYFYNTISVTIPVSDANIYIQVNVVTPCGDTTLYDTLHTLVPVLTAWSKERGYSDTLCLGDTVMLTASGGPYGQLIFDGMPQGIFTIPAAGFVTYAPVNGPIGPHTACLVVYSANPDSVPPAMLCSDTVCLYKTTINCTCAGYQGQAVIVKQYEGPGIYAFTDGGSMTPDFINWYVDGNKVAQTPGNGTFRDTLLASGDHQICMQVAFVYTDTAGNNICCYDEACDTVFIDSCDSWKANASISYAIDPFDYNQVTFTYSGYTHNLTVVWNFGDGTSAVNDGSPVTHTYDTSGNWQVCAEAIWSMIDSGMPIDSATGGVCCCVDTICFNVFTNPCRDRTFTISLLSDSVTDAVFKVSSSAAISIVSTNWTVDGISQPPTGTSEFFSYPDPSPGLHLVCVRIDYDVVYADGEKFSCDGEVCDTFTLGSGDRPDALISYFPNPTDKLLTVVISTAGNTQAASIEVSDNLGRPVITNNYSNLASGTQQLYVDFTSVLSGIYIMKIKVGNTTKIVKVVRD